MRALVVYESSFGNTGMVAEAVWRGLADHVEDAALRRVDVAPTSLPPSLQLLVVGGPTQAFGMSRPSTRQDAQAKAGLPTTCPTTGVREWLHQLEPPNRPVYSATFDTRIHSPHVPGSAAVGAWRLLNKGGFELTAEAESFWVEGLKGPLRDGELDRAYTWGVSLSGLLLGAVRR
ncbi:flavodoxin family protein [Cellulomonas sp. URHD0024]|uniref:flavodoxin family protein n=1 Tax=Cellulomonas sp. URHD0024 TaxID=1302620 RepID=UPI00040C6AC1|nr:flavodoxin family protein [Cellulomonas sp. URHD0024]